MKAVIRIDTKGLYNLYTLEFGQSITVGRSTKCNAVLDDDRCSSNHCRILLKKNALEISDLNSKNGTFLNGIRIEQTELFVGDEVRIGESIISIHEQGLDEEAKQVLSFPGDSKQRMDYELKMDFTGARLKNQEIQRTNFQSKSKQRRGADLKEVELRKKLKSRIKLSKEEIKEQNKSLTFTAYIINYLISLIIFIAPFVIIVKFTPGELTRQQKVIALVLLELFGLGTFALANFRLAKFSLGERLAGIKKIYEKQ